MAITSAIAIYFVLWWVVLFAVLPFGVRSQIEQGDVVSGSDPSAPAVPRMAMKLLWTTIVSAVLFAIGVVAYRAGWLNVERLTTFFGFPF